VTGRNRTRLRGGALLSALAFCWGCAGDPQPAPGTEPAPTPAPSQAGQAEKSGLAKLEPLRYRASEHGLLIQDPVSGFSLTTPGSAKPAGGGGEGPLAYELQAKRRGWALRIRREATPAASDPNALAERLVLGRALRKPVEVAAFRPGTCARWGVEAAVSGIYPLGQGEAWERVLVLVRGARAIVLWETVDASLGRAQITELNGRCYASFRWGGSPRRLPRKPSPYVDAKARLTAKAQGIAEEFRRALNPDDLARAEDLLSNLAYSAADPPDEALHAKDREAITEKLAGLGKQTAARLRLELRERVKTVRDLRGLHQVLEAALP
jgi:hypothetical protein